MGCWAAGRQGLRDSGGEGEEPVSGVTGPSLAWHTGATIWLFSMAAAPSYSHLSSPFPWCEPQIAAPLCCAPDRSPGRHGCALVGADGSAHTALSRAISLGLQLPVPCGVRPSPRSPNATAVQVGRRGLLTGSLGRVNLSTRTEPRSGSRLLVCFKNMYLIYTRSLVGSARLVQTAAGTRHWPLPPFSCPRVPSCWSLCSSRKKRSHTKS